MVPRFRCWFKDIGTQAAHMVEWHELREFKALGDLLRYSGENKSFHLMQSTGLKDLKGVEIFEGDVVWIIDKGEMDNGWGWSEEVIFHHGSFMAGDDNLLANVNHRCVVSGNKYERNELLEPDDEN